MTEVNGLRLAYRGLIAGLAGGYVWAAIAMSLAAIVHGDPLRPLEPLAMTLFPVAGSPELSFVLGLGAVQAGGALLGMCFAYFFGRFFTVRPTLAAAGLAFALIAWGLVGLAVARDPSATAFVTQPIGIVAAIGFGTLLGAWVPLRGEVVRQSGSPST
jgi:hypothetical protein